MIGEKETDVTTCSHTQIGGGDEDRTFAGGEG